MNGRKPRMVASTNQHIGRVTALVAAFNCGAALRDSLRSLLDQRYADFEIIVVDDGSTDGSIEAVADLLSDPRLTVLRQTNAGKAAALNRAVKVSSGEFLMINDGDDLSDPNRAATLASILIDQPDLGGVMSRHALLVDDQVIAPRRRGADRAECAQAIAACRQPGHDPTLMFRRSAVGTPVFDPELRIGQGVDLVMRIGEQHGLVVVDQPLYHYRIDPNTHTRRDLTKTREYSRLVWAKAMERRGEDPTTLTWAGTVPGIVPVGHIVEAALDARVLDGRKAAFTLTLGAVRALGLRWAWYKPLVYALAPMSLIARNRKVNDLPEPERT